MRPIKVRLDRLKVNCFRFMNNCNYEEFMNILYELNNVPSGANTPEDMKLMWALKRKEIRQDADELKKCALETRKEIREGTDELMKKFLI